MKTESLSFRYLSKLLTNGIGLLIGFGSQSLIARGLGPAQYGNFSFLTNIFSKVLTFLQMGTLLGFYTKLSQRQHEYRLLSFYGLFLFMITSAAFAINWLIQILNIQNQIFPGNQSITIFFALIFSIFVMYFNVIDKIADALGLTIKKEMIKVLQKIIGVIILYFLFKNHQLTLRNFFLYNYLITLLPILLIMIILYKYFIKNKSKWRLNKNRINIYIKEFYNYSNPLFTYAVIVFLTTVFDRWMLQKFGGSVEQGFFGFSFKVVTLAFIFTSAMSQLLMREFSIAYKNKNIKKMKKLFVNNIPLLYSITAVISCFIIINADSVTLILGGNDFKSASSSLLIMGLYPIHQTYGQLSGSIFYATGQTKLYRNIGITGALIGMLITYFLVAPHNYYGMDFGAVGLSIKFVLYQIIITNVQLVYNSRLLNIKFREYLIHQFVIVLLLLSCGLISKFLLVSFINLSLNPLLDILIIGVVYIAIVLSFIYFKPTLFGLNKSNIKSLKELLKIITNK